MFFWSLIASFLPQGVESFLVSSDYIDAKFQGTVQLFRLLGCFTQAWFKGIRVSEHCLVLRRLPWNAVGGGGEGGCLRWVPQPADLRHRPQGP
jgi:hypothetical protein